MREGININLFQFKLNTWINFGVNKDNENASLGNRILVCVSLVFGIALLKLHQPPMMHKQEFDWLN